MDTRLMQICISRSFVYSSLNIPTQMHNDAYDGKMHEKGGLNQPLKI